MSSQGPQIGEISSDGLFRWDGQEWSPLARPHREPTSWTTPMRVAAAAYLVLGAAWSIATTALFLNADALVRVTRANNPAVPPDQLQNTANLGVTLGWAVVIATSIIMLVLALGSFQGWRWAFWAVLVWLGLTSVGVATNAVALANPRAQAQPPGAIAVGLVFSLVALALLAWFVAAAVRYGPWGVRRTAAG